MDSTGAASAVSVAWAGRGALNAPDTDGSYGFYGTDYANLMRGCLYVKPEPGTGTVTISGLESSTEYTVYLYTQGDVGCDGRTLTAVTNTSTSTSTAAVATASTFVENQNYLCFTGLTDATGTLLLTYYSTTGTKEADLNGLQIIAVPEPAMGALLALAASGMLALRRRKSA